MVLSSQLGTKDKWWKDWSINHCSQAKLGYPLHCIGPWLRVIGKANLIHQQHSALNGPIIIQPFEQRTPVYSILASQEEFQAYFQHAFEETDVASGQASESLQM